MGRVIGGIGISHTPSMGAAFDRAMTTGFEPEWQIWNDGTIPVKEWISSTKPSQIIIIYNDHLNHFNFKAYPTLAIGVAAEFPQADEGWGLRPFPSLIGDMDFSWHAASQLVSNGFDMTVCQEMTIDHGIYSWFPYLFDLPWAVPVTPIAVNMVRHPIPSSQRLSQLGRALRSAVESFPKDERILVIATGGMSHQISGERFGIANETLDRYFLEHLNAQPEILEQIPQTELMRMGGTEAAELSIWFAMRSALASAPRHVYDFYTFPKITGCGVIILEES